MVQVYADDILVYDSRLQDYALSQLKAETGLRKGGAAFITMPPNHPAFGAFVSYRTVVTIYREGELEFRGRALYPSDDFNHNRTITCEGERCFLRDGVMRPYVFQESPAIIFENIIAAYNAQVEAFKQFVVGTITVTDPNEYIRMESETAEAVFNTIEKLVERCGGFIVFTTNTAGQRVINWLEDASYTNNQVIEFGENMLDFTRTGENTDLATVIVPYGAKDETTGNRVNIESVNDGLDFIQDYDAVALRGVIAKAVYWDDITEPANLLRKAQQYLTESKQAVVSLELSAVDLSVVDKTMDSFHVGDIIRVRSKPHNVDDDYQLTDRSRDYLNPDNDKVVLGKDIASLTGADAAGDRQTTNGLQRVEQTIKNAVNVDITAQLESTRQALTTLIQQTSEAIQLEVSEQYATNNEVKSAVSTVMTQLSESFEFLFTELQTTVDENDASAREQFAEIEKYIRFENGDIVLGESGNELTLRMENDRISFLDAGAEVAYFSNKQLTVLDGHFLQSLRVGNFRAVPRENGNLSIIKVGE